MEGEEVGKERERGKEGGGERKRGVFNIALSMY